MPTGFVDTGRSTNGQYRAAKKRCMVAGKQRSKFRVIFGNTENRNPAEPLFFLKLETCRALDLSFASLFQVNAKMA